MWELVAALAGRRPILIPGRMMRLMTGLPPRAVSIRMNGEIIGQAARDLARRQLTTAEQPNLSGTS